MTPFENLQSWYSFHWIVNFEISCIRIGFTGDILQAGAKQKCRFSMLSTSLLLLDNCFVVNVPLKLNWLVTSITLLESAGSSSVLLAETCNCWCKNLMVNPSEMHAIWVMELMVLLWITPVFLGLSISQFSTMPSQYAASLTLLLFALLWCMGVRLIKLDSHLTREIAPGSPSEWQPSYHLSCSNNQ
jgi:hypothetical protein